MIGRSIFIVLVISLTMTQALTFKEKKSLRSFIESLMKCKDIVGLSIAMVKKGEVVFSQGFGYRDLESKSPMTSRTKTTVGSLGKTMTSALVADAVARGWVDWDTPLQEILGEDFQLEGDFRSQKVSMKDVLGHRLGMPSYWGFTTSAPNISREELVMK